MSGDCPGINSLDSNYARFAKGFDDAMAPRMQAAFDAMKSLESGAIANPDEHRMVGHYWLRSPELAPTREITAQIRLAKAQRAALAVTVGASADAGSDAK